MSREEYVTLKEQIRAANRRDDDKLLNALIWKAQFFCNSGQKSAITRMLRADEERAYLHDLKSGTPEGCW